MKERILGLDLGTTSVGFALVEYDQENRTGEIPVSLGAISAKLRSNGTEMILPQIAA